MQFRSSADISAGLPIGSGWRTFALIKCIWRRPGSPGLLPVKLTVELPAAVHRDLVAYAEALGRETGQPVNEPAKLIAPMLPATAPSPKRGMSGSQFLHLRTRRDRRHRPSQAEKTPERWIVVDRHPDGAAGQRILRGCERPKDDIV